MTDHLLVHQELLRPAGAAAAVIVLDDARYLLQLRDQKPGIFYPGHWGLFGGAIDPGETPEAALRRELREEIGLDIDDPRPLTEFTFTFGRHGRIYRYFFVISIDAGTVPKLNLREGRAMQAFTASDILTRARVVPYDSFAIWLHASRAAFA
jgi:8-oxo-dGTP pyrophosphatase MutT (NUDIX family)